uniref:DUF1622 domain-containing protein n=1 Tax=Candidatus Electrothrix sp. TaxID=2170559 RepID=UPI0040559E07
MNTRFITNFILFAILLTTVPALAQEPATHHIPSSLFTYAELSLISMVEWLKLAVEAIGALIIGLGVVVAVSTFIRAWIVQRQPDFNKVRLSLARYLALALEFQLGADILSTAVAPSWDQIGKLGAIAVIRTVLNFFLIREMREEGLEKHDA